MSRYLVCLSLSIAALISAGDLPAEQACWIWSSGQSQEQKERRRPVRLVRDFEIDSAVASTSLRLASSSADVTLLLDGKEIAVIEPYDPILTTTVETRVGAGRHQLALRASPVAGPSAVFLQLDLRLENGQRRSIVTDSSWKRSDGNAARNLGAVEPGLLVPPERGVRIGATDNYEQWKQAIDAAEGTDPASFFLLPGYEIRRVRSALPGEDSWVSMAIDAEGRILIAKEKQGLLRMRLSDDGNSVTDVEALADQLEECRGLVYVGEDLYANANNSKGLYRLPLRGDGFGEPELVFASSGGVGHGRNDLALGPDGKLYSIHGDAVDLPAGDQVVDLTSPYRDARRGKKTSEGHLLRIDVSAAGIEVLAAGLRNPFGIDFNEDGEIFTYDADAEYDMGAPWYRPTRVSHLVTGGDYGWRGVTRSWPPYYPDHPDNARPNLDIGKGSPTAVKFGTRSHFPHPYRDALFILDWAYGRIIAVHMVPRGASYLMAAETFLKGRPLNVTDLEFGPDGSMYLVTGGRQTQSALYRIRWTGDAAAEPPEETVIRRDRDRFAARSRRLRRQLESQLTQPPSPQRLAEAWKHLGDPDPWIRHAAINLIERHPTADWKSIALGESDVRRAVHGLTALCRSGESELFPLVIRRLNELLPALDTRSDKSAALYAYWMCLRSIQDLDDGLRQKTIAALDPPFPSRSPVGQIAEHNRLLSEMLVDLQADGAISKTVDLLNTAAGQAEQMHYLFVLRNSSGPWTIDQRRDFFAGLDQARNYLSGAGMSDFLRRIREEAIATLSESERVELKEVIEQRPETVETIVQQPRSFVRKWTIKELLSTGNPLQRRDLQRGAKVFAQASCIQCHRFGSRGTLIGPDLTSVGRRFNQRDLLSSIIEPSRVVADSYRSLQIVTSDGRTHVGQATTGGDYRSPVLRLATDPTQPHKLIEIPKNEIESRKDSEVSWMPEGLVDHFTAGEILDLVAYLQSAP